MTEPLTAGELLAAAAIIHTRADHGQPHLRALADRLTQAAPPTPTDDGQKLMASLLRFAASRGFESGITLNCLHELLNPTDHEKKDLHFDDLEE